MTGEYVDMIKAGILDPTKVVRCALENAASIAGMLLTTEAIVADIPEEKAAAAMPAGHGLLRNRKRQKNRRFFLQKYLYKNLFL